MACGECERDAYETQGDQEGVNHELHIVSKGFLQSEVLGEVSVLESRAKFAAKFLAKFSGLFCWDFQSKTKSFS